MRIALGFGFALLLAGTGCGEGGECPSLTFPMIHGVPATCRPSAAIYVVQISTSVPRTAIESCRLTITDEQDRVLLDDFLLSTEYDSAGVLEYGCAVGSTLPVVGELVYQTRRTSGALNFSVNAIGGAQGETLQRGETGLLPAWESPPAIVASLTTVPL
jgi:hypothetical protein